VHAPTGLHLQVLEWRNLSVHVPPMLVPGLSSLLDKADVEAMRASAIAVRRRLLWSSIYGSCHLAEGEGGSLDAFDTLMEARTPTHTRANPTLTRTPTPRRMHTHTHTHTLLSHPPSLPPSHPPSHPPSLTQVLRRPRTHFKLSSVHNAPRAPEMLDELYPALKKLHHPECTQAYQCFDKHRRSCFP